MLYGSVIVIQHVKHATIFPFITDPQDLQEEGLEESVEEVVVRSSLMNILGFSDIFNVTPVLFVFPKISTVQIQNVGNLGKEIA